MACCRIVSAPGGGDATDAVRRTALQGGAVRHGDHADNHVRPGAAGYRT